MNVAHNAAGQQHIYSAKICVRLSETFVAKCCKQSRVASIFIFFMCKRLNYTVRRDAAWLGYMNPWGTSSPTIAGVRLPPARPEFQPLVRRSSPREKHSYSCMLRSKHKTMRHLVGAKDPLFIRAGRKREDELFLKDGFWFFRGEIWAKHKWMCKEPRQTGGACSSSSGETNAEGKWLWGAATWLPLRKVERRKDTCDQKCTTVWRARRSPAWFYSVLQHGNPPKTQQTMKNEPCYRVVHLVLFCSSFREPWTMSKALMGSAVSWPAV